VVKKNKVHYDKSYDLFKKQPLTIQFSFHTQLSIIKSKRIPQITEEETFAASYYWARSVTHQSTQSIGVHWVQPRLPHAVSGRSYSPRCSTAHGLSQLASALFELMSPLNLDDQAKTPQEHHQCQPGYSRSSPEAHVLNPDQPSLTLYSNTTI